MEHDGIEDQYVTVADTARRRGQGAVWCLSPAEGPVTARQRAEMLAATFEMVDGHTLHAEELPFLPPAPRPVARLTPVPPGGPAPLDPPPEANADVLAFFRPHAGVPSEYRAGGVMAKPSEPQVTVVVLAGGVEVQARRIRKLDPRFSDTEALRGAATLSTLHEIFHSYVDAARQRFEELTGAPPTADSLALEEALANAFAALNVEDDLRVVHVAIAKDGDLEGYAELDDYLDPDRFVAELKELGRAYFGPEHVDLIAHAVADDNASGTAICVALPDGVRASAYRAGAWRIDGAAFAYVIPEFPF